MNETLKLDNNQTQNEKENLAQINKTEFETNLDKSNELGLATAQLLNRLNHNSLYSPDQEYQHQEKNSIIITQTKDAIDKAKKDHSGNDNTEFIEEISQSYFKSRNAFKEFENGNQIKISSSAQADSDNIITEKIINHDKNKFTKAISQLDIKNPQSGLLLDFGQLLPKGYRLKIEELNPRKKIRKDGKSFFKKQRYDLKEYEGMESLSQKNFQCIPKQLTVSYGNLSKKGGILALLHEISHAWQCVYHEKNPRAEYYKLLENITPILNIFTRFNQTITSEKMTDKNQIFKENEAFENLKKKLEAEGVEIDLNNFVNGEQKDENEIILKIDYGTSCVVKSKKLKQLLKAFEFEERNAWAHAVKIIRFLRRQGFDIEPNIKTAEDFESIINPNLKSYDQKNDQHVNLDKTKTKFLKK